MTIKNDNSFLKRSRTGRKLDAVAHSTASRTSLFYIILHLFCCVCLSVHEGCLRGIWKMIGLPHIYTW